MQLDNPREHPQIDTAILYELGILRGRMSVLETWRLEFVLLDPHAMRLEVLYAPFQQGHQSMYLFLDWLTASLSLRALLGIRLFTPLWPFGRSLIPTCNSHCTHSTYETSTRPPANRLNATSSVYFSANHGPYQRCWCSCQIHQTGPAT